MSPTSRHRPRQLRSIIAAIGVTLWVLAGASPARTDRLPSELRGLDGRPIATRAEAGGATILIAYSTECPISNAIVPALKAIAEGPDAGRVRFIGLCVDPDLGDPAVADHAREFGLPFPVVRDRDGALASGLGLKVTPEVVLIDAKGRMRYRGRVDDQFVARRVRNAHPGTHELRDAIAAVLGGREVAKPHVEAVGCPLPTPSKPAKPG